MPSRDPGIMGEDGCGADRHGRITSPAPTAPLRDRVAAAIAAIAAMPDALSQPAKAVAQKLLATGLESLTANEQATYEAELLPLLRAPPGRRAR